MSTYVNERHKNTVLSGRWPKLERRKPINLTNSYVFSTTSQTFSLSSAIGTWDSVAGRPARTKNQQVYALAPTAGRNKKNRCSVQKLKSLHDGTGIKADGDAAVPKSSLSALV